VGHALSSGHFSFLVFGVRGAFDASTICHPVPARTASGISEIGLLEVVTVAVVIIFYPRWVALPHAPKLVVLHLVKAGP
jgi:hypothetical protein